MSRTPQTVLFGALYMLHYLYNIMIALGVDYGTKRVGIAISDEGGQLAFPYKVIDSAKMQPKDVAGAVGQICQEKAIKLVVLGESKNFKGEDNTVMQYIKECGDELTQLGLEVSFEPEWFSTQEAERFQGKKDDIDSSAAAVILQSFLDRRKFSKNAAQNAAQNHAQDSVQKSEQNDTTKDFKPRYHPEDDNIN